MSRARARRVPDRTGQGKPAVRHAELHLHPAPGRIDQRGAGQRRAAGGRADGRLSVTGGVTNALNMPSLSAEEAPKLKPYMALAEKLAQPGRPAGGTTISTNIAIEVEGAAAELNIKPITGAVLSGFMRRYSDTVNMVNAPYLAKERGLDVREVRHDREAQLPHAGARHRQHQPGCRSVAGTLFGNSEARAWSRCSALAWRPIWKAICSISSTRTRPASSAGSAPAGRGGHQHRHLPPRPPRCGRRGGAAAVGR
jgi:hypothetical protein